MRGKRRAVDKTSFPVSALIGTIKRKYPNGTIIPPARDIPRRLMTDGLFNLRTP
jgi:hypothetical protein